MNNGLKCGLIQWADVCLIDHNNVLGDESLGDYDYGFKV